MAMYHTRAAQLKPLVEAAGFTAEQLNLVHKMMRGCTMLRQGKVITSFFGCMLPESFELKEGAAQQGKYGTYRPIYVVNKGAQLIETFPESPEDGEQ
jgi:hypothetical protein